MKILLLGANGQVGHELRRALAPLGGIVVATRNGELDDGTRCLRADLADRGSLAHALAEADAEIVVNAAACTAVDHAEDEPDLADRINHRAVAELGAWAARRGALVAHYSTDYVFDGLATLPYRETDPTAPLGVYGHTKLAGEEALRAGGAQHFILRTAWVYAARGHNFLRTVLRLAGEREELRVVADQIGAPTPAALIADATAAILERWRETAAPRRAALSGTYHLTASGQCSWHAFAASIVREAAAAGLIVRPPRVMPIATADYPTRARRPAYSVLDCGKLTAAFGIDLQPWQAGLQAVLGEIARIASAPRV